MVAEHPRHARRFARAFLIPFAGSSTGWRWRNRQNLYSFSVSLSLGAKIGPIEKIKGGNLNEKLDSIFCWFQPFDFDCPLRLRS
jgi:hypothetical protein